MGTRPLASLVVLGFAAAAFAFAACAGSSRPSATNTSTASQDLVGASSSSPHAVDYGASGPGVEVVPGTEGGVPPVLEADGGFRCGCALCAPVLSEDKCVTAADCAPQQPCHADRCVARRKAKPRTPETVCTMEIRCNTADVNRCACIQGVCALAPPSQR